MGAGIKQLDIGKKYKNNYNTFNYKPLIFTKMKNDKELSILTAKLATTLTSRSKPVVEAIAQIEKTGSMLDDYVVPVSSLLYFKQDEKVRVGFPQPNVVPTAFGLHDHAVGQVADKLSIPPAYLKGLVIGKDWQKDLSIEIMQRSALNVSRERVLVRTVENEVRGFLSDKYRRLNSMEIFMAFLMAAQAAENVLVDAHSGETKGFLEVINPKIIEFDTPLNGRNYAVFGARIRNSDFGDGALEVRTFMINVQCMNGLVGQSMLKEFHLGGRIPDNVQISEDTYRKDTTAKAALVKDIMASVYSPENTDKMIRKIEGAASKELDLTKEVEKLPKLGFTLGEAEAVNKVLMQNNPADGLQGSPTLWKLVNGMTAVARESKPERRRELEQIAGEMLTK
jgi:hypothetical protein